MDAARWAVWIDSDDHEASPTALAVALGAAIARRDDGTLTPDRVVVLDDGPPDDPEITIHDEAEEEIGIPLDSWRGIESLVRLRAGVEMKIEHDTVWFTWRRLLAAARRLAPETEAET